MNYKKLILLIIMLTHCIAQNYTFAACSILTSNGQMASKTADALNNLLLHSNNCPSDVFALRTLLKKTGYKLEATMVANRGFHNPSQGSFSIFEIVTGGNVSDGDFFFGHFTTVNSQNQLIADQSPEKNSLMIEALAWDSEKEVYNFYELRGNGKQGQWYYRGNSVDIYADNELLHRQKDPANPQFGNRLRCSACHGAGGPIMKELEPPHNDWWGLERKLDFGGRHPDASLREIMETLVPSARLSNSVKQGIIKLNQSKIFAPASIQLSMPELLRPLFCPIELNLMSDLYSNDEHRNTIAIPIDFFLDSRLLPNERKQNLSILREYYEYALTSVNSHFPETSYADADHAWLTPVKATADKLAVERLIKQGIIDEKFMLAVLSIDILDPIFSEKRCQLLKYLPNTLAENWHEEFINNLRHSRIMEANILADYLTQSYYTPKVFKERAEKIVNFYESYLLNQENVKKIYKLLIKKRADIHKSEISKNPRGQILEPGFRVIFPESS